MLVSLNSYPRHKVFFQALRENTIQVLDVDDKGLVSVRTSTVDGQISTITTSGDFLLVGLKSGGILTYDMKTLRESQQLSLPGGIKFLERTSKDSLLAITVDDRLHRFFKGTWRSSSSRFPGITNAKESPTSVLIAGSFGVSVLDPASLSTKKFFCLLTLLDEEFKFTTDKDVNSIYVEDSTVIFAKDKGLCIKLDDGLVMLKVHHIVNKSLKHKTTQDDSYVYDVKSTQNSIIAVAVLPGGIVNVWQVTPANLKPGMVVNPKVIDVGATFRGTISTVSLQSHKVCLLGGVDKNGKGAILTVTDPTTACTLKYHSQEGLTKEQYIALSFEERLAHDKNRKKSITVLPVQELGEVEDFSTDFGDFPTVEQLRAHFQSVITSSEKFHENLFTIPVIPTSYRQGQILRQAVGGLISTEIDSLVRLSLRCFESAPVERVRVLTWLKAFLEVSAAILPEDSRNMLQDLKAEIAARMEVFSECLRLQGRTKLLLSHASSRKRASEEEEDDYESSDEEDSNEKQEDDSGSEESSSADSSVESMDESL